MQGNSTFRLFSYQSVSACTSELSNLQIDTDWGHQYKGNEQPGAGTATTA